MGLFPFRSIMLRGAVLNGTVVNDVGQPSSQICRVSSQTTKIKLGIIEIQNSLRYFHFHLTQRPKGEGARDDVVKAELPDGIGTLLKGGNLKVYYFSSIIWINEYCCVVNMHKKSKYS